MKFAPEEVNICDCGAEKCKTTHSDWCSSLKKVISDEEKLRIGIINFLLSTSPAAKSGQILTQKLNPDGSVSTVFVDPLDIADGDD